VDVKKCQRLALFFAALCIVSVAFFGKLPALLFCRPQQAAVNDVSWPGGHTTDQNMYFSFIRQAYDGNILFNNRLTAAPNQGAFVNLSVSRRWASHAPVSSVGQRCLSGVASGRSLLLGLRVHAAFLVALPTFSKRLASLCVFIFCSGFGTFIFLAARTGLVSHDTVVALAPDLWSGLLPFPQLMLNPHFFPSPRPHAHWRRAVSRGRNAQPIPMALCGLRGVFSSMALSAPTISSRWRW